MLSLPTRLHEQFALVSVLLQPSVLGAVRAPRVDGAPFLRSKPPVGPGHSRDRHTGQLGGEATRTSTVSTQKEEVRQTGWCLYVRDISPLNF